LWVLKTRWFFFLPAVYEMCKPPPARFFGSFAEIQSVPCVVVLVLAGWWLVGCGWVAVLCVIYWTCVFQVEDWNRSWEGWLIEEYGKGEMRADSSPVSII